MTVHTFTHTCPDAHSAVGWSTRRPWAQGIRTLPERPTPSAAPPAVVTNSLGGHPHAW